jgi:hypothetical protein
MQRNLLNPEWKTLNKYISERRIFTDNTMFLKIARISITIVELSSSVFFIEDEFAALTVNSINFITR